MDCSIIKPVGKRCIFTMCANLVKYVKKLFNYLGSDKIAALLQEIYYSLHQFLLLPYFLQKPFNVDVKLQLPTEPIFIITANTLNTPG